MSRLVGLVSPSGTRAYFFSGDQYVRYDVANDAVDPGYPKPIAGNWPGLFDRDIDAAVVAPSGNVYFFRGTEYIRYDWDADQAAPGYPRPIEGNWHGLFPGVDAAISWDSGKIYFFQGQHYVRYDPGADHVDAGYPKVIAGNWPGLFAEGIESALWWPSGNVYFFAGDQYVLYDPVDDAVPPGYPQPIAGAWPGLPFAAPPAASLDAVPARALTAAQATAELTRLQSEGLISFATSGMAGKVDLVGRDPATGAAQDGNVAGVRVRYWGSGTKAGAPASAAAVPRRLDPRHALAIVRLCRWLAATWGATELFHAGVNGDGSGARTDCHGQGRALDLVGVAGTHQGTAYTLTVYDDWGHVTTPSTPGGSWTPAGTTSTHFRLDDVATTHAFERSFFQTLFDFCAGQWQDRSSGPDPAGPPTTIGSRTFLMNPDHPTSSPGQSNGREAHATHLHAQIGVTGTA